MTTSELFAENFHSIFRFFQEAGFDDVRISFGAHNGKKIGGKISIEKWLHFDGN
jgi:hypothetical protein